MKKIIKKIVWAIIIIGVVVGGVYVADAYKSSAVASIRSHYETVLTQQEMYQDRAIAQKVEKLQQEIVNTLADCETRGIPEGLRDSAMILDTNKEISIGRFMYQRKTVIYYYKKLYGKDITRDEAVRIAVTKDRATKLTTDILFQEKMGWKNWYNCSKRHNLPEQIELINKIK